MTTNFGALLSKSKVFIQRTTIVRTENNRKDAVESQHQHHREEFPHKREREREREGGRGGGVLTCPLLLGADTLSPDEGVEGPGLPGPGRAAETLAAVRRVDPAGRACIQSTGHAAAAAGLPQHLPAVRGDGGALAELLWGAGGAADWLGARHRGAVRQPPQDAHTHHHHRRHHHRQPPV